MEYDTLEVPHAKFVDFIKSPEFKLRQKNGWIINCVLEPAYEDYFYVLLQRPLTFIQPSEIKAYGQN